MLEPIIQARGLTKTYGRGKASVEAVRSVDLQVQRGQIFGLVGPDGAGKTTTIQMLCGLLTPSAGDAAVAGIDVVADSDALGGVIGYMSEGFTLYGSLSVEENLDFFADLYKVPPELAAERKERLLHFARLDAARHRRAEHLSGGMKKKLALSCALIYHPQVLFLDEPTTGVDPVSRQDFWKILFEFLAEGITIFVSTPYMDEAERCNRVALMHQGRIIAEEGPSELKNALKGVAVEMIARPQRQALARLREMPAVSQVQVFGDRLHLLLREASEGIHGVEAALAQAEVSLTEVRETQPSLEDVFIAAVGDDLRSPRLAVQSPDRTREGESDLAGEVAVRAVELIRTFKSFSAVDYVAVDRLSFEVQKGEIFGFLGPNGSGKTTTIRMLTGLLPPTAGEASVAGFDVVRQRAAMKPHIGYMSQKFSLYDDLTIGENIHFFGDVYDLPAGRLAERKQWVLEMAGLTGREHLLTRDLAGGWKQRLALGCAILHEPEILFLDEPTSGVDPVSRREFWDLISDLCAQGKTIFITTHYMDEAEHCHVLGLLYQGRLIAIGSPAQLRADMKMGALVEVPVRNPLAALVPLKDMPEIIQTSIFGDKLHVLVWDPEAGGVALESALSPRDLISGPIHTVPISLEDLFTLFIGMEETGRKARQAQ